MPHSTADTTSKKTPKKLVLCFDGTGNTFSGSTADTNVVKIYDKLDRDSEDQFHYYQTGIGTYDIGSGSINQSFIGTLRRKFSKTIDQGFATTFDAHVIAGYRFIMRYYDKGDKIYMFGFSRGAFTARFLSRMINTVGLLSKGNEEMVPFAYQLYQEYEQGKVKYEEEKSNGSSASLSLGGLKAVANGVLNYDAAEAESLLPETNDGCSEDHVDGKGSHLLDENQARRNKLRAFTETFCRREEVESPSDETDRVYTGVKVHFLGLFDCVSSVKVLEGPFGQTPPPVSVIGTAKHVRHAVAIDERRVKFKAALLAQDTRHPSARYNDEDIKEVWFPGNHGDIGGGWPAPDPNPPNKQESWWAYIKRIFNSSKPGNASGDNWADPYQMSDVALHWMINEVKEVGRRDPWSALKWSKRLDGFETNFNCFKESQAFKAPAHDTLRVLGGLGLIRVMLWNLMEWLPFMARWEIDQNYRFYYERMRPNMGSTRDIPADAVFHDFVSWKLENDPSYRPKNNLGGKGRPCLTGVGALVERKPKAGEMTSKHHKTFALAEQS
ncbi:hypothetical protein F4810DRAFT_718686 [Camillea tinctor]|nr:hypothetical protein F4810DRAFT_718686 [Camillea tinctor]